MTEAELLETIGALTKPLGSREVDGEEFKAPPLDVLAYFWRKERVIRVPILGWALSVVAVVRQPPDLARHGSRALLDRIARATNARFPSWPRGIGLTIGLTTVVLTPEPIREDEERRLEEALGEASAGRGRIVHLGLLRVNLGQQSLAVAVRPSSGGLFPEASRLADGLSEDLGRFVPLLPP